MDDHQRRKSWAVDDASYIPPDPKDDKAFHTALNLIRGIQKNSAYPPGGPELESRYRPRGARGACTSGMAELIAENGLRFNDACSTRFYVFLSGQHGAF